MTTSRRRRVFITGGTSGIGRAAAARLAQTCEVFVVGSRPETVDAAIAAIPTARGAVCDVSDQEQCLAAVASAVEAFGGLDAAFVNAGIDGQAVPATDIDLTEFARLLRINLVGALGVAQAVVPVLSRPGTLLFNASMNGLRPEANFADYNSSKAGVISLAKTLALELGPQGISSIALCPGYFPTRMTEAYFDDPGTRAELLAKVPLGRFGTLAEMAELVDFLLSPAARYLNGSVVSPDGGVSI
jgi:NAD(P)-dependent dehydrogenase (short-subunit alcohol dehydrogenase family)